MLNPVKNRDGYFSNDDVIEQASKAMQILKAQYPDDKHVLVFDNAQTHSKCAEVALSAMKMPKNLKLWGVPVNVQDENRAIVYDSDGKPHITTRHMEDTT